MSLNYETAKTQPRISKTPLLAVLWTGTILALLALISRLIIRLRIFKRLKTDDYLVTAAFLFFLSSTLMWQVLADDLYFSLAMETNVPVDLSNLDEIFHKVESFLRATLANYVVSYSCLWAIKLSFMAFFRTLGRKIRTQQIIWWSVLVFIFVSYVVCVATLDYRCFTSTGLDIIDKCMSSQTRSYELAIIRTMTALDMVSDAAIVVVSGNIVWRARIHWKNKLALAGVCSLTALMLAVAPLRIAVQELGELPDFSWLLLWTGVEMTLAIIVACAASFRTLFTHTKESNKGTYVYPLSRNRQSAPLQTTNDSEKQSSSVVGRLPSQESQDGLWDDVEVISPKGVVS